MLRIEPPWFVVIDEELPTVTQYADEKRARDAYERACKDFPQATVTLARASARRAISKPN